MNRLRSMIRKVPIRRKLMGMILLTTCVALLVAATAFFAYEIVAFRQMTIRSLTATADVIGANCAAALVFEEASSVETTLRSLAAEPQIVTATAYDRQGRPVARYQRGLPQATFVPAPQPPPGVEFKGGRIVVTRAVAQAGEPAGTLSLQADLAPLQQRARNYLWVTTIALVFALFVGFALSLRLQVLISRPIVHLTEVASRVARERNYSLRAQKFDDDEIGALIGDFNNMLGEIQQRDLALQSARDELEAHVEERTAQLRRSEAFYQSLVQSMPLNMFRKDTEGRFTFCNQRFCSTLGVEPDQILGRTDADFFPEELASKYREDDLRVIQTGVPFEAVEAHQTHGGERRYVEVLKTALADPDGRVVAIQGLFWDVTAKKRAEQELELMHKQLLDTSRRAGMAEVATGVLHNVGNVLNSVNVTTTLLRDQVRKSRLASLAKAVGLIREQNGQLARFLVDDPRGKQLPDFLDKLTTHLQEEQATALRELDSLAHHIDHIKEIVAMQQAYARVSGVREIIAASELLEDALRMNAAALVRHDIQVLKDYDAAAYVNIEKNKVLQILINLVSNAKYACDAGANRPKILSLRVVRCGNDRVQLSVSDNGVGIPPENLTRIFELGFTTKRHGHGFGLHSSANTAREMGGSLSVRSDGPGCGAIFTLELPADGRPSNA